MCGLIPVSGIWSAAEKHLEHSVQLEADLGLDNGHSHGASQLQQPWPSTWGKIEEWECLELSGEKDDTENERLPLSDRS